jgi:hypothetical protein
MQTMILVVKNLPANKVLKSSMLGNSFFRFWFVWRFTVISLPKFANLISDYLSALPKLYTRYVVQLITINLFLLQTHLYKEDWIRLQSLDKAGKIWFIAFLVNHLSISETKMEDNIVPFLVAPSESSRITWMDTFWLESSDGFLVFYCWRFDQRKVWFQHTMHNRKGS